MIPIRAFEPLADIVVGEQMKSPSVCGSTVWQSAPIVEIDVDVLHYPESGCWGGMKFVVEYVCLLD